jgi:NTP pyrophosphatase (non-canonical NTP hydrolase)
MRLSEWQDLIRHTYLERDRRRGLPKDFMWFVEEVGELSEALRFGSKRELEAEFADCLAWLTTLANLSGVDLERAIRKYRRGCPSCRKAPCRCRGKL